MNNQSNNVAYYIDMMPSTKEQVSLFVEKYENEILEGNENPLKVAVQLKAMEETIKNLRNSVKIRDVILEEANKYGKSFEEFGAKFNVKETGVSYDFSGCGDSNLESMYKEMEGLKERIKKRETFLKSITDESIADTETGEILLPPCKVSTTSVTVTLK